MCSSPTKATRRILDEIWGCLLNPIIGTIGIYGLAGVGKSTAMMNITNQLQKTDISEKIIWVTVSKNQDFYGLHADIATQLGVTFPGALNQNWKVLSDRMKNLKKHLLVLDDMWRDLFGIGPAPQPTETNGCKIEVISRYRDVCARMEVDKLINLAPLCEEDTWILFVHKASNCVLDPDLERLARQIVNECGGLPIAITTVGHAMRDAQTVDEWSRAYEYIVPSFEDGYVHSRIDKGDIFNLLRFAYNRLKNDTVRKCSFVLRIFLCGLQVQFETTDKLLDCRGVHIFRGQLGGSNKQGA